MDLLASNSSGSKTIAIQVKTAKSALRRRGRGDKKKPHHLEFTLGKKAVKQKRNELIFCFVDLNGLDPEQRPDVYVIPAIDLCRHYENSDVGKHKWFRLPFFRIDCTLLTYIPHISKTISLNYSCYYS